MRRILQNMDPNLLASMLQSQLDSNPALQRLMDENPHLRHMMNDPGALQQAAQLMRDPDAMQQAMRQQDLALSQIENMPGGFASLSNMYRNMQAPLEESLLSSRQAGAAGGAADPSASARPSASATLPGTAMPNPWGSAPSSSSSSSASRTAQGSGDSSLPGLSNDLLPPSLLQGLASDPNAARRRAAAAAAANPWASAGGGPPAVPGLPPLLPPGAIRSVMDLARQNPELFRAVLRADPRSRSLLGDDPAAIDGVIRRMQDPHFLQMMESLGGQMGGGGGVGGLGSPLGGWSAPPPGGGGTGGPSGLDFSSLLQSGALGGGPGLGGPSGGFGFPFQPHPPPSSAAAPPRERFRGQLRQLADMGFDDEDSCLAALQAERGNVNRAVDRLLSGPPAPSPQRAPSPSLPSPDPAEGGAAAEPPRPASADADADEQPAAPPKNASEKKND
jgi:ubiquilin